MNPIFPKENTSAPAVQSRAKSASSYAQVGLLILLIGLCYWFMIRPKQADLKTQNEKLSSLEDDRQLLAENVNKLQSLIEKLKAKPGDIKKLDEALPLNGKTFGINLTLEEYAKQAGVVLAPANLNPRPEYIIAGNIPLLEHPFEGKRALQKLSTNIQALGSFPQLINFVKKIENSPRLIQINDFAITDGKEGLLNLNMSVDTYYYE